MSRTAAVVAFAMVLPSIAWSADPRQVREVMAAWNRRATNWADRLEVKSEVLENDLKVISAILGDGSNKLEYVSREDDNRFTSWLKERRLDEDLNGQTELLMCAWLDLRAGDRKEPVPPDRPLTGNQIVRASRECVPVRFVSKPPGASVWVFSMPELMIGETDRAKLWARPGARIQFAYKLDQYEELMESIQVPVGGDTIERALKRK